MTKKKTFEKGQRVVLPAVPRSKEHEHGLPLSRGIVLSTPEEQDKSDCVAILIDEAYREEGKNPSCEVPLAYPMTESEYRYKRQGDALTVMLACDRVWAQVWIYTIDMSAWTDEALELVANRKVRRLEWWPIYNDGARPNTGNVILCHDNGETELTNDGVYFFLDEADKLAVTLGLGPFNERKRDFTATGISQERHRYLRLCEQNEVLRKLDIMLRGSVFTREDLAELARIADEEEFGYYDFFNAINQQVNPELYQVGVKEDATKSS